MCLNYSLFYKFWFAIQEGRSRSRWSWSRVKTFTRSRSLSCVKMMRLCVKNCEISANFWRNFVSTSLIELVCLNFGLFETFCLATQAGRSRSRVKTFTRSRSWSRVKMIWLWVKNCEISANFWRNFVSTSLIELAWPPASNPIWPPLVGPYLTPPSRPPPHACVILSQSEALVFMMPAIHPPKKCFLSMNKKASIRVISPTEKTVCYKIQ
jgi:hypothetical protein